MIYLRKLNISALTLSLLFAGGVAKADTNSDIETLLNWAEGQYPELFPQQAATQTQDIWRFRYYPQTNIYAGVNDQNEVYVLGEAFGEVPMYVGTLSDMLRIVNSGDGDGDGQGQPVTFDAFDLFGKTGIWRLKTDFQLSATQSLGLVTATINSHINTVDVQSIQFNSPTDVVISPCSANTALELDNDEFNEDLVNDATETSDELFCQSGSSYNYFKVSDDHYRIDWVCNGSALGSVEFERISNSSTFAQGSLSFTTNQAGGTLSSSEVCGGITQIDTTSTNSAGIDLGDMGLGGALQDTSARNIHVAGTYDWGRVMFTFTFSETPVVGTYAVADSFSGSTTKQVTTTISSPVLGGTGQEPASLFASTGAVTINSISDTAANACFDLTTITGETFDGCFNFNLQ
jgi:hypothetical protein